MTSVQPPEPGLAGLAAAVRAGASGLYSLEAACELVISAGWLRRDLRLAASIAAGIPVDLNDALSGLDQASISLVACAIRHANGQRPDHTAF
jgi:hypothetical protein